MRKTSCGNSLLFLAILVCAVWFWSGASVALASSGSNVFRGSVSPNPNQQSEKQPEAAEKAPEKAAQPSPPPSRKAEQQAVKTPAAAKDDPAAANAKPASSTPAQAAPQNPAKTQPAPGKQAPAASDASAKTKKSEESAPAGRQDLYLHVQSAILINMNTGKVYFEQNPDKPLPPASITKLLTLYLVREGLAQGRLSLKTPIPISDKAARTRGARMTLKGGEKVPLGELIQGISVASANNACVAVAEYLGKGDPAKFVAQMNAKAKNIGMSKSAFKNPNGLPANGQLSTARDIAKLSMSYMRAFPDSLKVHAMTAHTYHGTTRRNANSLLRTYKGVDGLKTGFVCETGYNIAVTAKRDNTRLLAVLLGAQSSSIRHKEATRLLDYGFRQVARESGKSGTSSAKKSKS